VSGPTESPARRFQ